MISSQIGEVARIVHFLRKYLVNRTVASCQAFEDTIVYGKVGTSAAAFSKAVEGKKVIGVGQQGKYFYLTFDSPPHSVLHLGMTGWIKFSAEETGYYRKATAEGQKPEEWPPNPKWTKWLLKCEAEGDRAAVEVAFVDARRLARIRVVDCDADKIREVSPLKENGPDPVIDKEILTAEWLADLLRRKKVPVKALLLDQANISGIGNWVADEILYQARLHPEQYSNTFDDEQIKTLHDQLISVCTTACELLADSEKFPKEWLMKHRWDKGKKGAENKLPNGAKIEHITVGGRTSAIVPSVQKKTGPIASGVKSEDIDKKADVEKKIGKSKKRKVEVEEEEEKQEEKEGEEEEQEDEEEEEVMPTKKRRGEKPDVKLPVTSGSAKSLMKKAAKGKKPKIGPSKVEAELEGQQSPEPKRSTTKKAKPTRKGEEKLATLGSRRSSRNKAS